TNAALAAYQRAVETLFSVPQEEFFSATPSPGAGFGWTKVRLFQDSVTETSDVKLLQQGTVSGTTLAGNGQPTAAVVRVSSLVPSATGFPTVAELGRVTTDPVAGTFSFSGIARFDLDTFSAAGVRAGDFTLQAAAPFSPATPQFRGQLSVNTPNQSGI